MIVFISSKQAGGKTTLVNLLTQKLGACNALKHKFARPMYEIHNAFQAILAKYEITGYNYNSVDGDFLQTIGKFGRNKIRKTVWAECVMKDIRSAPLNLIHIVEDGRFRHEFDLIKTLPNVLSVRLECAEDVRKNRCDPGKWRQDTQHDSEIDLDEYAALGKFDMYFNTEFESAENVAEKVLSKIRNLRTQPPPLDTSHD